MICYRNKQACPLTIHSSWLAMMHSMRTGVSMPIRIKVFFSCSSSPNSSAGLFLLLFLRSADIESEDGAPWGIWDPKIIHCGKVTIMTMSMDLQAPLSTITEKKLKKIEGAGGRWSEEQEEGAHVGNCNKGRGRSTTHPPSNTYRTIGHHHNNPLI